MHADWLTVTMSEEHATECLEEITPHLGTLGLINAYQGLYKFATGGTLLIGSCGHGSNAHVVGASGGFLSALRAHALYDTYLSIIGSHPHRVTRLDVAHDVLCDAPAQVLQFDRNVRKDKYKLNGRKINLETGYKPILNLDRHGARSGTVYIGPKSPQKAALKVYDKSKEQWDRYKREIPQTLRWELKLGRKSEVTLRDAWEPDPVFWHFMSDVLPTPNGVPSWSPHGEDYTLPPRVTLLPAESLKRLVESSDIVDRMFALTDKIGPNGFNYLVRVLQNSKDSHTINKAASDRTLLRDKTGS